MSQAYLSVEEDCLELIYTRRSVRRFELRTIPEELVDKILEAGARAPSPHNTQPWSFVVVSGTSKRKLGDSLRDSYLEELRKNGDPDAEVKARRAWKRTVNAPLLILLSLDRRLLKPRSPGRKMFEEWIMGIQSLAAAAENMLLAAHFLGLAGCWRAAPLFCQDRVRKVLRLDEDIEPQILLEIGYPESSQLPRRKKRWDELSLWKR